jgi:hypothetical protein
VSYRYSEDTELEKRPVEAAGLESSWRSRKILVHIDAIEWITPIPEFKVITIYLDEPIIVPFKVSTGRN